ncbi:MAG TPA: MCE family protein [Pseudonocardia sp.]|jgi:virulence factor Mce-like protein|nr:MCE family protein [Pseudonocardia sp.]
MSGRLGPRRAVLVLVALMLPLVTGCSASLLNLPLPAPGAGDNGYRLTAVFRDALNLPESAHVKLGGDDVGAVQDIVAKDYTARVSLTVRSDVVLPVGTTAELRQATPLGEIFVALHPPEHPATGAVLRDGDVLDLPHTATATSVEDLLVTLSTLVNGAGLAQIQTIVTELNGALNGRSVQTAHLTQQATSTLGTLTAHTQDIDRILAATRDLTATLNQRHGTIDRAFSDFTPALQVLADRTDRFSRTLHRVGRLADRGDNFLDHGGSDIRALARDLGPVLDGFYATRSTIGPSLRNFIALGKLVEQDTKGESFAGAGSLNLAGLIELPRPGDRLPGPNDFIDGGQSFSESLQRGVKGLGLGGGR